MKAVYPDRTVYTPFPDYEAANSDADATMEEIRTTYRLAGQIVALRVTIGSTTTRYYPLTDRLGNVMALSDVDGVLVSGSAARYDPFGAFTAAPTSNPSITNHGFTGHRHNNTSDDDLGLVDLGLIYMNARYYLPEVGRFISPDTIVPEPGNQQSHNRYSYTRNNPLGFTDPTGYKEIGRDENHLLSHEAPPSLVTPIWTGPIVDNPDWAQPPGRTEYGADRYPGTSGIHTGMDWGKSSGEFEEGNSLQFPVRAGCDCIVVSISAPKEHYDPWRVDLASTVGEYSGITLIYGHLAEVQVKVGEILTPESIIGYLETTKQHVHVEMRRSSDNAYINPWPYLAPDLQDQMRQLMDEDTFLPGGSPGHPRYGYYEG